MNQVKRLYVEKKPDYAVMAKKMEKELHMELSLKGVEHVRVLTRYDVENVSEETYQKALGTVFSEPPVDFVYEEHFPGEDGDRVFSVEYLPGQFDQRADSAVQCLKLLGEKEEPVIRSATTYVLSGELTEADFEKIKAYCINPVDSRETDETKPDTLIVSYEEPADVAVADGFKDEEEDALKERYDSLGLAMTFQDFLHIQKYFSIEEKRDPTMTEIRVLDTYWSDHCRHTTFSTELTDVSFADGYYKSLFEKTYERYIKDRKALYGDREDKYVCLMDLASLGMKVLQKEGKLSDREDSEEINACSIVVPVTTDGETKEWLISFKNETHNHPTEIEPFGGAATCLGGAIRDPLAGRNYVYQAMRVTGCADPTKPLSDTLKGKLSQRKLTTGAAEGYSSYGNQIGLATGLVDEIYHPGYVAKRMEIGAVMGAAPRENVVRGTAQPGDVVVLLGGRTGRDGCGGATGSSKAHTLSSIDTCGAEVQKGNPPTERKMQRLFRRAEVSRLIKKCNDFGAGGVSVAIGELADGLHIYLDRVPKKYAGLDGTELAISESQERMAVVLDPADLDRFLACAAEENLEAVAVAEVTKEKRLVMEWRGKEIVNLSRAFLDTNGAHQEANVFVAMPDEKEAFYKNARTMISFDTEKEEEFEEIEEELAEKVVALAEKTEDYEEQTKELEETAEVFTELIEDDGPADIKTVWLQTLSDLNVCSKKGLVEMFDSSIGAATVAMPYGGKTQMTPIQTMSAKLPALCGEPELATMMAYGFDPYISSWSPYHGAVYAVVHSVAKIVAAGGDYKKIRFTFQEYFEKLGSDSARWGKPFAALLGAYEAQMAFGLPSLGGKDSMSGSFEDIDVPPTLVSFAVDYADASDIITPEFKKPGSSLFYLKAPTDACGMPDFEILKKNYDKIYQLIKKGVVLSAYAVGTGGLIEAVSKMSFGNRYGARLADHLPASSLTEKAYGSILMEVDTARVDAVGPEAFHIGWVAEEDNVTVHGETIDMEEMVSAWTAPLESVFPTKTGAGTANVSQPLYSRGPIMICKNKTAVPQVFIPVFPGTNCEYDSAAAFKKAGAKVETLVFKNQTEADILESAAAFSTAIKASQILMFPGGFSAGDEPAGSAKFFASVFRNEKIKEAVLDLLTKRDGLVLGICNGFQALIKLGLVPYGDIVPQTADSPTLTTNEIGRHVSTMVYTKVISKKSPWLKKALLDEVYALPASHGEGRFVADEATIQNLFKNGQVATQYVNLHGDPTMDVHHNPNGSYYAIEGITSPDGRVFGKMAHSERIGDQVAKNICQQQNQHLFESGVEYFQ